MKHMKMKKVEISIFNFLVIVTLVILLSVGNGVNAATQSTEQPLSQAQLLTQCINGKGAGSSVDPLTGHVNFIHTKAGKPISQIGALSVSVTSEDAARNYLSHCGLLFGLENQDTELILRQVKKAESERTVVRFQQVYEKIPVFAGELLLQLDRANNIILVNGDILPDIKLNITPTVKASTARLDAINAVAVEHNMSSDALRVSEPELWIYDPALIQSKTGSTALVWRMEVTSKELAPIRHLVLVDAHNGSIIFNINQVDTALNRLTYTANNTTTRPGSLVCNESKPTCAGGDTDAVNAHLYGGDTYNFYSTNHSRDSLDNAGMALISTVHYDVGYCNAFWDGTQMTYGDGCSIVTDDVVAHEMTHGVTEHESNLVYAYESGAINESFSDVWGEFVDLTNGKGTDTAAVRWKIGEDIPSVGPFRDMKDPRVFGDPDRMGSPNFYTGSGDNGGVHTNSGVNNKAAYLMTDGDTFNGYTITGIGITKVAKIYYEVQTNILTSGANYSSLYNALNQACNNLIGTSGITSSDCNEVNKATLATEMNTGASAPTPPANDDFDNAATINSLPYTVASLNITGATEAVDDPVYPCGFGGQSARYKTVWYAYTPGQDQSVKINTFTSTYDTVLGVWSGSRGNLTSVGCNDDTSPGLQSQVTFSATSGTAYYIEISSYSGGGGTLTLSAIDATETSNDDFDTPEIIDSVPYTTSQSTLGATIDVDDPVLPCGSLDTGSNTVWYQFTPATDNTLHADTITSDYDTMIALWIGTRGNLTNVACNDDYIGLQSQIAVPVQANVTYYLEIAGFNAGTLGANTKPNEGSDHQITSVEPLVGGNLNLYVNLGADSGCSGGPNSALFTTQDNENNAGSATGDCDMDSYVFNTDSISPIEFTINVPNASGITSADLLLLNWDVDETSGEVDEVYFNGHYAGTLTGADNTWSTTALTLNPAWLVTGDNNVRIEIDVTNIHYWTVETDWGQLVLNGGSGTASIRTVDIEKPAYKPGDTVSVDVEVDTSLPSQDVHTEISLRDPNGAILDSVVIDHAVTGLANDPITVNLNIPSDAPPGTFDIQALVYDFDTNIFQGKLIAHFKVVNTKTIKSTGTLDGWILESSETSNQGGTMDTTGTLLYVGDDAQDKQYKSILSFDTSSLPNTAVITEAQLRVKVNGFAGGNMFTPTKILGNLLVDIRKSYFGTNANLAVVDFQAKAGKSRVGRLTSALATGWYTITLNNTAYTYINRTATTQLRLRFRKDDNDDTGTDYLKIYSGNAPAANRPQLIIRYYVP